MAHAPFGHFAAEREVQAVARQLRQGGLTLRRIADQLASLGYKNRSGNPHNEMGVSRILRQGDTE